MLAVLADLHGEIGVNQLGEQVNLSPSTVHRILRLLVDEGIAAWNPSTHAYSAGPALYRLGARVVANASLPNLVAPYVQELAQRYDETVLFALYLPAEAAMSFAVRADGDQPLQYRIEMHAPLSLLWGASGKAILAFLSADEIQRIHAATPASPGSGTPRPSLKELRAELDRVRDRGVSTTVAEKLPGARGIAAPVFDAHGVVGSLVLTSPADRLPETDVEAISEVIAATAATLSEVLGHSG